MTNKFNTCNAAVREKAPEASSKLLLSLLELEPGGCTVDVSFLMLATFMKQSKMKFYEIYKHL